MTASCRSADTLLMLTLIIALTVAVGGVLDALRRAVWAALELARRSPHPEVLSACLGYAVRADSGRASGVSDLTILRQFLESGACLLLFDVLWAAALSAFFPRASSAWIVGACSALLLFGLALAGDLATKGARQSGAALTNSSGRLAAALGNVP
jgi:ATP-binding cassette subfamily C protein